MRSQLKVKPAVGFTLPSAGVTPAPSEKYKSQNGEDAILLSGSFFCVIQSAAKNPVPILLCIRFSAPRESGYSKNPVPLPAREAVRG
jgi:hypothetical protein